MATVWRDTAEPLSQTQQLLVLRNALAELIIVGMRLKDAQMFGSYDELRRTIATLDRQYLELEREIG